MPRALISVSDKRGIVPFAQGLVELGWEVVSTGGTAAALRDRGARGHHRRRSDPLPRAARWSGQDAPPGHPRRAARAARPARPPRRRSRARDRAHRARGGEPVSVPDDHLAPRRLLRRRGREHRHRRTVHAPFRRQEPRVRAAGRRSHRLPQGARPAPAGRARRPSCAAGSRPRCSPTPPITTRRSPVT